MAQVNPVPDGFHTVTPHIMVRNGTEALAFYKKAFGAEEICCMMMPDGSKMMHAEIRVGDSPLMLAEEMPQMEQMKAPASLGATTCSIALYVPDCDAAYQRAVDAGCTPAMPPTDMFWGDRYGKVIDPDGHHWAIATHVQDLTPEEIAKAAAAAFADPNACQ